MAYHRGSNGTCVRAMPKIIRIEPNVMDIQPHVHGRSAAIGFRRCAHRGFRNCVGSLSACPYQFYARQVLGIAPIASATEAVSPSDIGNAWHKVVEYFHKMRQSGINDEDVFAQSIEKILHDKCVENPRYWALKPSVASYQSAFVRWWQAREAQGWHHVDSEYSPAVSPVQTIVDAAYKPIHSLQWQGRIDQVDENAERTRAD